MKPKSNFVSSFLISAFLIVTLILKKSVTNDVIVNGGIAAAGLICYLYYLLIGNKRNITKSFLYGMLMSFFMFISILYNSNANLSNILWVWSFLGVALLLYERGVRKQIALVVFVFFIISFLFDGLVNGIENENLVISTGSVNNISSLCMIAMCIYYISKYRENPQATIDYWPIAIIMFISILTATRSSIFALMVFFGFAVYYNGRDMKSKSKYLLILSLTCIALIYFYLNYFEVYGTALQAKSERMGMESARTLIWRDYINGLFDSLPNLLLGVPGDDPKLRYLSLYSGNTHNAFLMLHSKYGLAGFLVFVVVLMKSARIMLKNNDWFLFGVFLLIVVRSSFDWTAFPGLFDIFFWYFFFYGLNFRKQAIASDR